jgi:hypothetical protein
MIVDLSVIARLKTDYINQHPLLVNHANTVAGAEALGVIVGSVVSIGLWLWLASACKNGRDWSRTVGTVLLGVDTLGLLITIGGPGIPTIKAMHFPVWLMWSQ